MLALQQASDASTMCNLPLQQAAALLQQRKRMNGDFYGHLSTEFLYHSNFVLSTYSLNFLVKKKEEEEFKPFDFRGEIFY